MTRYRYMPVLAAFVAAWSLQATPAMAEKWDMPVAYPATNFHSENATLFAKAVGICTENAIDITVHSGGSLFKGNDIKRAVQTGQAPIGERLLSAHANENELFAYDAVPFLLGSFDESDQLYSVARPTLEKILDKQNLVLLYTVPWPPQGLYFKQPVSQVSDMKGIKFRSYNAATARLAALAGMLPVQIEAAELSQALATGVAESFISSGSTGNDMKVWEHLTHFYDTQAWLPRNTVFVNKDSWNGLDGRAKACLRSSALLAEQAGANASRALASWYLQQLAAHGMTRRPAR